MDHHQEHHDRIVQRGLAETLACQDMLARALVVPPRPARLLAWLRAGVRHRAAHTLSGRFAGVRVPPGKAELGPSPAP
jgi:hypothetical protein